MLNLRVEHSVIRLLKPSTREKGKNSFVQNRFICIPTRLVSNLELSAVLVPLQCGSSKRLASIGDNVTRKVHYCC